MASCPLVTTAGPEHLDEVYAIEVASFDRPYPRWYIKVLRELAGDLFLVALCGGRVAGYAVALPRRWRSCHLASIAVAPGYRRRRLGAALLASVEQLCWERGMRSVVLEVEATNAPALALYRAFGYLEAGLVPDYYGPGRHALLMIKPLEPAPVCRLDP